MSLLNLYEPTLTGGQQELFETLLQSRNVTIERIQSPAGTRSEPFLQQHDEWVCLLQGEAQLELDGEVIQLKCGGSLFIAAGTPHRVLNTSAEPTCIWLAVHIA